MPPLREIPDPDFREVHDLVDKALLAKQQGDSKRYYWYANDLANYKDFATRYDSPVLLQLVNAAIAKVGKW